MKRCLSLTIVLGLLTTAVSYGATVGNPPSWNLFDSDAGGATGLKDLGWTEGGHPFDETLSATTTTISFGASGTKTDRAVLRSPTFSAAGDWTMEMRVRYGEGDRNQINNLSGGGWEVRTGVNDGNAPGYLLVGTGAGIVGDARTPGNTNCSAASTAGLGCHEFGTIFPDLNLTNLNVFRVTVEGGQASIYISENGFNDTARFGGTWSASGGGNLQFYLDSTDGTLDEVEIDYVRAADGAFTPAIPEPATMALLGLGGLLLIRRRRRA
jgi:hypothetical protein